MRGAKIVAAMATVAPVPAPDDANEDDEDDDDDEGSISLAWAQGGTEEEGAFSVSRTSSWSAGWVRVFSSSFLAPVEEVESSAPILEGTEAADPWEEEVEEDRERGAHFVVSFSREDDFRLDDSC